MSSAKSAAWVLLLLSALVLLAVNAEDQEPERPINEALEDAEPDSAILFPWFAEALGLLVFFILTRYLNSLPFTAVMFVIGMGMGMGAQRTLNDDRLTTSILQWTQIDSEVLLLVFLPGLIFNDAFALNVHLFLAAFWQIINFAFPMVLAGAALTALYAFYLFPYGWSFNLAMTFGSILSATDPAAVASLMESLGAPPRLQMHIGGESMLNDGSSYVFYTIFSAMFLTELGISGVGEIYDLGGGVAVFFREAFGAAAYGILFGVGLVFLLYIFNRKHNDAENVVQILSTITMAYLAYFTADISGCSGVIATVGCGITAKAYGNSMINDPQMMSSFWALVDQLLNTLLFTLAGVVWGVVIAGSSEDNSIKGKDWGFAFMSYILLNAIRFFLVFSFYPVTARIGIGTDWQEAVFSSYAGLRGGVGISLALSLFNAVSEATEEADGTNDVKYTSQVTQLFFQIGGIVFLTLVVNGTTAGPLLNKLGLAKSPDSRVRLLAQLKKHFLKHIVDEFVKLLADPRFPDVYLPVVQQNVPFLKNLTLSELKAACLRHPKYKPNLEHILPYLDTAGADLSWANVDSSNTKAPPVFSVIKGSETARTGKHSGENIKELRHFFLEVLNTVYNTQLENGELDGRDGFVSYSLIQSIDFASSDVDKGMSLDDWQAAQIGNKFYNKKFVQSSAKSWESIVNKKYCCINYSNRRVGDDRAHTLEYRMLKTNVLRAVSFIEAHRQARKTFTDQLADSSVVDANEQIVLDESNAETATAQQVLDDQDPQDVLIIKNLYFCAILLNKSAKYTERLLNEGVLEEKEASVYLDEIDTCLISVKNSSVMEIPEDAQAVSKHVDTSQMEEAQGSPIKEDTKESSASSDELDLAPAKEEPPAPPSRRDSDISYAA